MPIEKLNINSKPYWNKRFGSGDWAAKGGYSQTKLFAESQVNYLDIANDFSGAICDFGCGAGDAFPIYRSKYPCAKLIGVDFSDDAIRICKERFGDIAEFHCVESKDIPKSDVIICSNVLEHINEDAKVLENLLLCCRLLFVIVPYKEDPLSDEHVRRYSEESFAEFRPISKRIILSKGWSKFGVELWYQIYVKNIGRKILGRQLAKQQRQIIFEFKGALE